jgi:hypothetical protein
MADSNWRQVLQEVNAGWDKKSFVPMPGGQQEPVAGASPATAALAANQQPGAGGAPAGPDPALVQQLMQDPALMQQLMQDPAMAEQMGIDPATLEAALAQAAGSMGDPAMLGMDPSGGMIGAPPAGAAPEEGAPPAEGAAEAAPAEGAGASPDELVKLVTELKDMVVDLKDEIAEMKANADLVGQVTQLNDRLGRALGDGAG